MSQITSIVNEVVGSSMSVEERFPVLCEIVKKTENLQVRALAILYADESWKDTHGTWTAFCRSEFGWDDSYASRMKKAAEMVLGGVTIVNESQARALASVLPEMRNEVLEKARKTAGREPSAAQISMAERDIDGDDRDDGEPRPVDMKPAQSDIDECLSDLRAVLKKIKSMPGSSSRWINMPHLIADMKSAAEALKHARPHGPCDEWGKHDENCLCGGTGWLPKHVLERPRKEDK